jgi:hypothetical protein
LKWKKPDYPERNTDHGQATGKFYHLWLRVECTLFCNLQSRARTHAVLVIGLYELLGNPRVIVFNATFNNISVISWQSDLMVEDVTSKQKEEFFNYLHTDHSFGVYGECF